MLAGVVAKMPKAEAEEYLRRILEHLFGLDADSCVRLAAASGSPPSYRIEMEMEPGSVQTFGEFSGKTHRELTLKQSREAQWYVEVARRSEVQMLIGHVRRRQRP